MSQYVFVYGTLKRGQHNHSLLEGCQYISDGFVDAAGIIDLGGCPGMVLGRVNAEDWARGEIYRMPNPKREVIARLDQLENEGSFYKRIVLPVWMIDKDGEATGSGYQCITYVYLPAFASSFVPGGNWELKPIQGGVT